MLPHVRRAHWLSMASVGVVALLVTLATLWPIAKPVWWENHDMRAYPVRLIEYVQALRAGVLFPRWCPDLYGGYGAPLFDFYSPGVFVVAAPFALVGLQATVALKISVVIFTMIGLVASYLLAETLTNRRDAAYLALGLFALAPYRFTQLFTRGDLAEYSAIALVPLVLLGYARIRLFGPTMRRCLATAFFQASVLLTHTITGQWTAELAGLAVLVWCIADLRARRFVPTAMLVATYLGSLGLTSIYALPALVERSLVRIVRMTEGGLALDKNFLGELAYALAKGFFFVGYPYLLLVPCAFIALAVAREHRRSILVWGGSTIALTVMMTSFSAPLWHVLPLVKFTQFPWRLLGFIAVTTTTLGAVLWPIAVPHRTRASDAALVAIFALLAGRAYYETALPRAIDGLPVTESDVASKVQSTVISDEYLPLTADAPPQHPRVGLLMMASPGIRVEDLSKRGVEFRVVVDADQPGAVTVAQHWFPSWVASRFSGPSAVQVRASMRGMIQVDFPVAGHYEMTLNFTNTPVRIVAACMSALAALLVPLLLFLLIRRSVADAAELPVP